MFDFAIFAIATYQENRLFCLRNCAPLSKVRLRCLRNCDFITIAIRNFAIIAIFAIHFTTLLKGNAHMYFAMNQCKRTDKLSRRFVHSECTMCLKLATDDANEFNALFPKGEKDHAFKNTARVSARRFFGHYIL